MVIFLISLLESAFMRWVYSCNWTKIRKNYKKMLPSYDFTSVILCNVN